MPTIPALDVEALESQVQGHRLEHKELKAKVTHRPSQENKTNRTTKKKLIKPKINLKQLLIEVSKDLMAGVAAGT